MQNGRTLLWGRVCIVFAVGLAACAAYQAQAQIQMKVQIQGRAIQVGGPINVPALAGAVPGINDLDQRLSDNVFLPPDRSITQRLARAQQLLEADRFTDAARYLGSILEAEEDFFHRPNPNDPSVYRSLKGEAQRLVGTMPRKGRDAYRLLYGARANRLLGEALQAGDQELLAAISSRYFHTDAGYQATLLLGLDALDRDRPLAAALSLERLRAAPDARAKFEPSLSLMTASCWMWAKMPDQAAMVLESLRESHGGQPIMLGEKSFAIPDADDNVDANQWLADAIGTRTVLADAAKAFWAMFRGSVGRNGSVGGGTPLMNRRWRVPVLSDQGNEEDFEDVRERMYEEGYAVIPGLHPLAVDDTILMRTDRNLLAIDFRTGKRLWEVPYEDVSPNQNGAYNQFGIQIRTANSGIDQEYRNWSRLFCDSIYGRLSSDGELVFAVEDLPTPNLTSVYTGGIVFGGVNGMDMVGASNRLAAYNIKTGKLIWHVGGAGDDFDLPLAGTFFLGAPLPLMGRLFVIGECQGEIRLYALSGETGELLWSQTLAVVERPVNVEPIRRLCGASPSYASGILVCPTSAGAVVAVDLATHSLMWGYRYEQSNRSPMHPMMLRRFNGEEQKTCFEHSGAIIAGDRVIIAPPESAVIHCVSLIDGNRHWAQPREDALYVACVHDDNVVVVGRESIRAYSLTKTHEKEVDLPQEQNIRMGVTSNSPTEKVKLLAPKPAWNGKKVTLGDGCLPSGFGFYTGDTYCVPLKTAETLTIDLNAGKVLRRTKSRRGTIPGNLICYKGQILSQDFTGVEKFLQLEQVRDEVNRRLADDAEDATALALQGELLLEDDRYDDAIDRFRRSGRYESDARVRLLLREAMLDALRQDFAKNRGLTVELEGLLDTPADRMTYDRVMASGLHAAGEWIEALDRYLGLVDASTEASRRLERISAVHQVRRDHWVRGQLASLREDTRAKAPTKLDEIDGRLCDHLDAALQEGDPARIRRLLAALADHPAAKHHQVEVARHLLDEGQILEGELLLWPALESEDPEAAAHATAMLANSLRDGSGTCERRVKGAAILYKRLGERFADVAVDASGKTGRQCYEEALKDAAIAAYFQKDDPWPTGRVVIDKNMSSQPSVHQIVFPLMFRGSSAPFYEDAMIALDQSRSALVARDGLGNELWRSSLIPSGGQTSSMAYNMSLSHVRSSGHLVAVGVGTSVAVVDPISEETPKLLWRRELNTQNPLGRNVNFMPQIIVNSRNYATTRLLGPVTSQQLVYQQQRNLVAVEPRTGDILWIYSGLPSGANLFGDGEYIVAWPNDTSAGGKNEIYVFRSADGTLLARRDAPATFGRGYTYMQAMPASLPAMLDSTGAASVDRYLLLWKQQNGKQNLELYDPVEDKNVWEPKVFDQAARATLVGREKVAVCEPDGHYMLISLPEGNAIIDTKLDPLKSDDFSAIITQELGDMYLVIPCSYDAKEGAKIAQTRDVRQLSGAIGMPVFRGTAYAFDLDGTRRWKAEKPVEEIYYLLGQPGDLPVATFAGRIYNRQKSGTQRYEVRVWCLDKRSGKVVCDERFENSSSMIDITGKPETNEVTVALSAGYVKLKFTDQPVEEEAKEEAKEDTKDQAQDEPKPESKEESKDEPKAQAEDEAAGQARANAVRLLQLQQRHDAALVHRLKELDQHVKQANGNQEQAEKMAEAKKQIERMIEKREAVRKDSLITVKVTGEESSDQATPPDTK